TDAPGGTANWSFTGGTNYNDATGTAAITIQKADAVISVNGYTGTYDGAAHGATGTATGVGGANLSSGLNLGATFTDAPGGTANWSFTGGTNYNDATGTAAITIQKADAVISVTGYTGVYDGAAHGASGTATGIGGANLTGGLNLGATFTSAPGGTANWSFAGGTNYNDASGSVQIAISRAMPTVAWSNPAAIVYGTTLGGTQLNAAASFGGASLPGTFTYSPAAGTVLSAGGGQLLSADFAPADAVNFNPVAGTTVHIDVLKAPTTVTAVSGSGTFGGTATLTATLSPALAGRTISFSVNGTAVCGGGTGTACPTTSASGTATLTGVSLGGIAAGTYAGAVAAGFVEEANYLGSGGTGTLAVGKVATTSAVTVTPGPQQYSDRVSFEATLAPGSAGGAQAATTVTFRVGTQTVGTATLTLSGGVLRGILANVALVEPTPFGTAPAGQMAPGPRAVTAEFTGVDPNFTVSSAGTTLQINKENAGATYTGTQFASTGSGSTATVTLSATIQDATALNAAGDPNPGDVRNARVTFWNRDTNQPISGCVSLPVGLVSAADPRTGTATCNWAVTLGSSENSRDVTVGVVVDGYYARNSADDNSVVTVSRSLASFITGGGYLVNQASAGQYAGEAGRRTNFGFNVKYNRSGTNLQGNVNIIVRNGGRVYQVKANSLTSLSANTSTGAAQFSGKASIQDITDPLSPLSIDGNATLQMTLTDRGEPGSTDSIGITVLNKAGGTWFASSWNGTRTVEQTLAGGNLVVR
ncbi:MAG TPA: hypothetical protein VF746_23760, partial [Longimicrobium sp.]